MGENIALILIIILQGGFLLFCLLMLLYFSSAIFVWPPSIPTDRRSRRAIVDFIKTKHQPDANIKIVDLGSGYGHLVRDLSRKFKNAEITGVELLRLPYLYSKFIFCRNKNIKIIKDDLYAHNLSQYDAIVFFLRKDHQVDGKVKNEVKKGALVISNNFPLKEYQPLEVKQSKELLGKWAIYLYEI